MRGQRGVGVRPIGGRFRVAHASGAFAGFIARAGVVAVVEVGRTLSLGDSSTVRSIAPNDSFAHGPWNIAVFRGRRNLETTEANQPRPRSTEVDATLTARPKGLDSFHAAYALGSWRNWQTRQVEGLVHASGCWFESSRAQSSSQSFRIRGRAVMISRDWLPACHPAPTTGWQRWQPIPRTGHDTLWCDDGVHRKSAHRVSNSNTPHWVSRQDVHPLTRSPLHLFTVHARALPTPGSADYVDSARCRRTSMG